MSTIPDFERDILIPFSPTGRLLSEAETADAIAALRAKLVCVHGLSDAEISTDFARELNEIHNVSGISLFDLIRCNRHDLAEEGLLRFIHEIPS